jgi:hypothetical protein
MGQARAIETAENQGTSRPQTGLFEFARQCLDVYPVADHWRKD